MILGLAVVPLVMALIVLPLRKLPLLSALLSASVSVLMAMLSTISAQAGPTDIYGRVIELSPQASQHLTLCYLLLALVLLYVYRMAQEPLANSLALASAGFLAAAVIVRNVTTALLLLEAGAVVAVMLLATRRADSTMTAIRTLSLFAVSAPMLLLATSAADSQALSPGGASLSLFGNVALVIGVGIFLAVAPLHVWQPPALRHGNPLATLMLSVVLSTVFLLRLDSIRSVAWSGGESQFAILLQAGGAATFVVGCLGSLAQGKVRGVLAYTALADMGIVLIAMGMGTVESRDAAMRHLVWRNVGIAVVSMAAEVLCLRFGSDEVEKLRGAALRAPLAVTGMALGGFSLAGLPPLAGFVSRFGLYHLLASRNPVWAMALIGLGLGPTWAFMRCAISALGSTPIPETRREPLVPGLLAAFLGLALLVFGLYPPLLSWLSDGWFDLLSRVRVPWGG